MSLGRVQQLLRVVPDAALDHDQIGVLAGPDRSDSILAAEECRPVQRRDADRLDGLEARFHQELDLPLIAETREVASDPDGVRASDQQSSRGGERALEFHVLPEHERCRLYALNVVTPRLAQKATVSRASS